MYTVSIILIPFGLLPAVFSCCCRRPGHDRQIVFLPSGRCIKAWRTSPELRDSVWTVRHMLDKSGLVRARLLSAACAFVIVPVRYTAELMKAVVHIILGGFCGSLLSRVSQQGRKPYM